MRTIFTSVYLLTACLMMTGCWAGIVKVPESEPTKFEIKIPTMDMTEFDKLKEYFTCDKTEAEMAISPELMSQASILKDKIESQDHEFVDCDGKTTSQFVSPLKTLERKMQIFPSKDFSEKVMFVQIENIRTCSTVVLVAQTELSAEETSQVDTLGHLSLNLTDSNLKSKDLTNLRDGKNLLKITWFNNNNGILETRDMVLTLDVERPKIPGVKTISTCR